MEMPLVQRRCLWSRVWNACRSVAQALEHDGNCGRTGTDVLEGAQERAIPELQPQQATCTVRVSAAPTARSHRPRTAARRCLWNACRSVAQALEHKRNCNSTGTDVLKDAQERVMLEPQPHPRKQSE